MADEILTAIEGGVATLTLNRPERRNAINAAMLRALPAVFAELEQDRDVRVVVVRGAGKAFCSGMDLDEMKQHQAGEGPLRRADGAAEATITDVLRQIERFPLPTIAMVNGDAFAGGCELALHCDLRIAADIARFAMPLARIGLVVPFALGQKLVEIMGPAHARHLLFTGQPVPARRAYEIGMVHQVVPLTEIESATGELARTVAANAPLSLAGMKAVIQRAVSVADHVEHADLDDLARRARVSTDAREGVRAMLERRPPAFRGE
jgi:enoyl-CoA hydratase/carnithine racemase